MHQHSAVSQYCEWWCFILHSSGRSQEGVKKYMKRPVPRRRRERWCPCPTWASGARACARCGRVGGVVECVAGQSSASLSAHHSNGGVPVRVRDAPANRDRVTSDSHQVVYVEVSGHRARAFLARELPGPEALALAGVADGVRGALHPRQRLGSVLHAGPEPGGRRAE